MRLTAHRKQGAFRRVLGMRLLWRRRLWALGLAAIGFVASVGAAWAGTTLGPSSDLIAATIVGGFFGAMIAFVVTRGRNATLLRSALELRDGTELLLRDGGAALLYWNLVKGELCWSEILLRHAGAQTARRADALPGHARAAASGRRSLQHRRSEYSRGKRRRPRLFPDAGRRWRLALVRFARPHQAARRERLAGAGRSRDRRHRRARTADREYRHSCPAAQLDRGDLGILRALGQSR